MTASAFPPHEPTGDRPRSLVAFQRASDSDRDRICDQLAMHYSSGRLRQDELDTRLYAAMRADTLIELRQLVADLPLQPQPVPVAQPPQRPQVGRPWSVLDVLALVTTVGALGLAFVALVVLAAMNEGGFAAAGIVGGTVAALGGASVAHLIHRVAHRPGPSEHDGS